DGFLDSALWNDLQEAQAVHTELPVARLADSPLPTLKNGTIDLLYQQDNAWSLVDFKTDRVDANDPSVLAEAYRPQLETYAQLWKRATGIPVVQLGLWLADTGAFVFLDNDGARSDGQRISSS
ncbi:MAG TPA: PD-(D/E)XK nuclease family protein, partial [Salinibacter sp.]|nr:PD-(D/E)XK nuclease family protein [Salinibacter sp.]